MLLLKSWKAFFKFDKTIKRKQFFKLIWNRFLFVFSPPSEMFIRIFEFLFAGIDGDNSNVSFFHWEGNVFFLFTVFFLV